MLGAAIMIVTALPLLIYPGVLLAGVMGLAAQPSPMADQLVVMIARSFMILSLLYPVVWGTGYAAWMLGFELLGRTLVCGNFLLCLALFAAWYSLSA